MSERATHRTKVEVEEPAVEPTADDRPRADEADETAREGAPSLETPESPAAPPESRDTLTDAQTLTVGPRASELDTGIGSALASRPSAFSPIGSGSTIPAPSDSIDSGQSSQMANRSNTFDEDPVIVDVPSPSPGY